MSDQHATAGHDAAAAHGDGHDGHGDDHGHGHDAALGPVDWAMWRAGLVGLVAGLVVFAGLVVALGPAFPG